MGEEKENRNRNRETSNRNLQCLSAFSCLLRLIPLKLGTPIFPDGVCALVF
jgi:hypothetical protein